MQVRDARQHLAQDSGHPRSSIPCPHPRGIFDQSKPYDIGTARHVLDVDVLPYNKDVHNANECSVTALGPIWPYQPVLKPVTELTAQQ